MSDGLFAAYAATLGVLTQRAQYRFPRLQSMVSFFVSMVPGELSHLFLVLHSMLLYYRRTSQRWVQLLHAYVIFRLVQLFRSNAAAKHAFQEACIRKQLLSPATAATAIGARSMWQWLLIWSPLPMQLALKGMYPGVECLGTKTYAHVGKRVSRAMQMDVFKHKSCGPKPPVFLFIHGGGWLVGNRSYAPQALLHQVCSKGWLFCSIDYRLAPFAGFPTNLIDCKRAIAYLRTTTELDLDAGMIVVGGESAGGHLASLVAVTSGETRFQPGFEAVDTSVSACIDAYGIHDVLDRHGHFRKRDNADGFRKYIEVMLMQKKLRPSTKVHFQAASSLQYVLDRKYPVPPFLLIHGEFDSVVPFEDSKEFYDALQTMRAETAATDRPRIPDVFIKVPSAQHAFNIFTSPRALAYGDTVVAFLEAIRTRAPSPKL